MRKTLLAAVAAVILVGSSQVPAVAAAPDAPTDVQISWADIAKKTIRISWHDNGEANTIRAEYPDLPQLSQPIGNGQAAGGSNEVILTNPFAWQDRIRITVESVEAGGATQSPRTPSVWFDAQRPAKPVLLDAVPQAGLSLRVTWSQATPEDITPNDPLDRPAAEGSVAAAVWSGTSGQNPEEFPVPAGSTAATIPSRPRPFPVTIVARNEWGEARSQREVTFATMTAGLKISAVGAFGRSIYFDVATQAKDCLPACRNLGGYVYLQARTTATQPWKTIGTYAHQGDQFSRSFATTGGQYYRLYLPNWREWPGGTAPRAAVTAAISTSARYSATQAYFAVAGFNTLTAKVGQTLKTTVDVRPAGTIKASLQWYDGKVWHHAAYIPLTKGRGTLSIKAAGRGTTRYWRVAVPKISFNGKPIVATGSRAFKLTVH